ncbi:N-acetyltransferase domain-containing protein [Alphaproteobacteria bacterium]
MTRTIKIAPYDHEWIPLFENEAKLIKQALDENCIAIHHFGSTSVPGLGAKPIIDILVEVTDLSNITPNSLQEESYTPIGEFVIPFHFLFIKRKENRIKTHYVHIFETGDPQIKRNLMFRDYLRNNRDVVDAYEKLKQRLAEEHNAFLAHPENTPQSWDYTKEKVMFVDKCLEKAGFDELFMTKVYTNQEWEIYHRIKKEQMFDPFNIIDDPNHTTMTADNNVHFILHKGAKIVSVAHIEFTDENCATLKSIATDTIHQGKGYAEHMMQLLEKWAKQHGKKIMLINPNYG